MSEPQIIKMGMTLSMTGLKKWSKMWKRNLTGLFSIDGRKLTDAEVRKVIDYAIEKGYDTSDDVPTEEVIELLEWNNDKQIL